MKFYCIIQRNDKINRLRYEFLEQSCNTRGVEFVKIYANDFCYTAYDIDNNSLLYRVSPGSQGKSIERWIGSNLTTLYANQLMLFHNRPSSFFIHRGNNLPSIETIPDFLSNPNLLDQYVQFLGGFPLITKLLGGSHGVGVIKVDSMESLKSLCDYFQNISEKVVLRKFIRHHKQGRLIVLGDKVIASHVNYCTLDFRSNVGENEDRKRDSIIFPEEIQSIAVKAVHSLGLEFGGVDILFEEETDRPYISEVNFPCYFPTTQRLTGIDIAGQMVDYLINKANRKEQ